MTVSLVLEPIQKVIISRFRLFFNILLKNKLLSLMSSHLIHYVVGFWLRRVFAMFFCLYHQSVSITTLTLSSHGIDACAYGIRSSCNLYRCPAFWLDGRLFCSVNEVNHVLLNMCFTLSECGPSLMCINIKD